MNGKLTDEIFTEGSNKILLIRQFVDPETG